MQHMCGMKWRELLFPAGLLLVVTGIGILIGDREITQMVNAATNGGQSDTAPATQGEVNYVGLGVIALGFLTLASNHYFRLRDARRADRAEAREIHDKRRKSDDLN